MAIMVHRVAQLKEGARQNCHWQNGLLSVQGFLWRTSITDDSVSWAQHRLCHMYTLLSLHSLAIDMHQVALAFPQKTLTEQQFLDRRHTLSLCFRSLLMPRLSTSTSCTSLAI